MSILTYEGFRWFSNAERMNFSDASRRRGTCPCWRRSIWRGHICSGGARRLHQCWIFFPTAWRSKMIAGRMAGRLLQHQSTGRTLPAPGSTGPPSTSTSPSSTTTTATTATNADHIECVQGAGAEHQEATLLTSIPAPGFSCLPLVLKPRKERFTLQPKQRSVHPQGEA